MRIYYLEKPLSRADLRVVAEYFRLTNPPTQVAIPYVLPVIDRVEDYMALSSEHEAPPSASIFAA